MKQIFALLFFFLLFTKQAFSQSEFQLRLADYSNQGNTLTGHGIVQNADGSYTIASTLTNSNSQNYSDFALAKISSSGQLTWSKVLNVEWMDDVRAFTKTSDGGYLLGGWSQPQNSGNNYDVFFLKSDVDGNITWARKIGGSGTESCFSLKQTLDGNFISAGYTLSYGVGQEDVFLVKFNSNGNVIWANAYGTLDTEPVSAVSNTLDSGFIVAGSLVTKVDIDGNLEWARSYYDTVSGGNQIFIDVAIQKANGNYILESGFVFIETNSSGIVLNTKRVNSTDFGVVRKMITCSDGGYALIADYYGGGSTDIALVKLDVDLNIEWAKNYGLQGTEYLYDLAQTDDNGFVLTGYTGSFDNNKGEALLIKTDPNGASGCFEDTIVMQMVPYKTTDTLRTISTTSISLNASNYAVTPGNFGSLSTMCFTSGLVTEVENQISIFPSPAYSHLVVETNIGMVDEINIYSIDGSLTGQFKQPNSKVIDVSQLAKGVYIAEVKTTEKQARKMWIKM